MGSNPLYFGRAEVFGIHANNNLACIFVDTDFLFALTFPTSRTNVSERSPEEREI
jgi:hypothetical protein